VPAGLAQIVMRCLAKAAAERYQRGNDLADALIAFLGASGATEEQRSAWIPRRTGATPSSVRS
jgi:serine/threonine-protein kinase